MAARKTPARYKSGPKKGQFKPTARRKSTTRTRARRNSTRKGQRRITARRAYSRTRPNPPRRRRARRNDTTKKQLTSVALYAAIAAIGSSYAKRYLGTATGSPMAASYGSVAALGFLGMYLTKKASTKPAGYAVLGVAFAHLAEELASATGMFETGAGFMAKNKVIRRLPRRVTVPKRNPLANIYVPS